MNNKINIFISPIIHKRHKFDLKARYELHKILKLIKHMSPSYEQLCEIYDFIELSQKIYLYNNDPKCHLFASTKVSNCKAFIYKEDAFEIKFILNDNEKRITISTTTFMQKSKESVTISFIDGEYQFKNIYDEERMLYIVASLMNGLKELILYLYKNKKF